MSEAISPSHPLRRRTDPIVLPVSGALDLLRTDPVVLVTLAAALLSACLQALDLDEWQRFYVEALTDLGMVLLAIAALLAGLDAVSDSRERRCGW